MKHRKGFVSNSSTSSFVCDMCGESYSGWDACPTDFDCSTCENEHIICNEHLKDYEDIEPKMENGCEHKFDRENINYCPTCGECAFIEVDMDYDVPKEACPICCFETYSESEMATYLEKTREISRDEVFAKVKEMNKRRRKLYNGEYVSYVCSKFTLTDEMLLKEIKERFGNFEEYSKFLHK